MEENSLPEIKRVIGLPQKQDEVTAVLAECFSRDLLGLEEYERRVELVQAASSLDDLERLVSDVPADVMADLKRGVVAPAPSSGRRQLAVNHGVQRMEDQRLAVGQLDLKLTHSVVRMRYDRVPELPRDMIIRADLTGSVLRICVPPEYAVEEDLENSGSVIKYRRPRRWAGVPVTGTIRITGSAVRSVIKIRTRRRRFR